MTRLITCAGAPVLALALALVSAPSRAETIQVTVDKMAFSPAEVTAKVGDTIEWVNKDKFAHTATMKGGFDVMLKVGKTGSVTVEKPGDIAYYCRFHPNMKGKIAVSQ